MKPVTEMLCSENGVGWKEHLGRPSSVEPVGTVEISAYHTSQAYHVFKFGIKLHSVSVPIVVVGMLWH